MPILFKKKINDTTLLGIWKIEENELFFKDMVPQHRDVTHPHKRLQHLAGRFLLKYLFPYFPTHLIQIADTRKPYLPGESFHFSISHCGDYAAAIVSRTHRVGIDIELVGNLPQRLGPKYVNQREFKTINPITNKDFTQIWSAKEAVFKWYGKGGVDFRKHIHLDFFNAEGTIFDCCFSKTGAQLQVHLKDFGAICLSYLFTSD